MTTANETVIYHNPRCSKSRQTLELMRQHGEQPTVIEYLKTPPSAEELRKLVQMLGITPRDLLRRKEPEYAELQLDDPSLSPEQLIEAMVKHPRLIERPIVVKGGKATLGRPPERVLDLMKPAI